MKQRWTVYGRRIGKSSNFGPSRVGAFIGGRKTIRSSCADEDPRRVTRTLRHAWSIILPGHGRAEKAAPGLGQARPQASPGRATLDESGTINEIIRHQQLDYDGDW